jgi:hypothetical protein
MTTRRKSTLGFTSTKEVAGTETEALPVVVEETPSVPESKVEPDPVPAPSPTPSPKMAPALTLTRVFPVVEAKQTRVPRNVPRFSEFKE